jgi:hypothetical protein
MRKLGIMLVAAVFIAACGDGAESTATDETVGSSASSSDAPDPCALADESVLTAYFDDAVPDGERGSAGPIVSCSWRDANSNSLLIQVAIDHDLHTPDPCDGCVAVTFGDDGYASESPLQSTATVVDGSLWLAVATTGFGDDSASIIDLLESVYENATG